MTNRPPSPVVPFPAALLPHGQRRGRRGSSLGHFVYLGSHPVLLMIGVFVNLMIFSAIAAYVAAVICGWLALVAVAHALRLGQLAAWKIRSRKAAA